MSIDDECVDNREVPYSRTYGFEKIQEVGERWDATKRKWLTGR